MSPEAASLPLPGYPEPPSSFRLPIIFFNMFIICASISPSPPDPPGPPGPPAPASRPMLFSIAARGSSASGPAPADPVLPYGFGPSYIDFSKFLNMLPN